MTDAEFMDVALEAARQAAGEGEVPVGAVVVEGTQLIATAANRREQQHSVLGHAELLALDAACRQRRDWRLDSVTLYVTLEPCPMCMGALLQARVRRLVYGASDPRVGSAGSVLDLTDYPGLGQRVEVCSGVRESECQALLEEFFKARRNP
jgi:tRNA(adenine34) deaminase